MWGKEGTERGEEEGGEGDEDAGGHRGGEGSGGGGEDGGEDGGDFMMVVLGESRAAYFTGLEERTKKREDDSDWNKIQSEPVATWVSEESLMITY